MLYTSAVRQLDLAFELVAAMLEKNDIVIYDTPTGANRGFVAEHKETGEAFQLELRNEGKEVKPAGYYAWAVMDVTVDGPCYNCTNLIRTTDLSEAIHIFVKAVTE